MGLASSLGPFLVHWLRGNLGTSDLSGIVPPILLESTLARVRVVAKSLEFSL